MTDINTQSIDEERVTELLKGIKIPPQPQIMVDIQMEMAMPDFSLGDIATLIAKDVGLSGMVLKAVNSSYFGLRSHVTSILQAINMLGLKSVINLINGISLQKAIPADSVSTLSSFWDNAIDIAMAGASISKRLGVATPDEAYTLGLFHNCAIPLMAQRFDDYLDTIIQGYQQKDVPVTQLEDNLLSTNHAVIGYFVARSWKLPPYLAEAILLHHQVDEVLQRHDMRQSDSKNLMAVLSLSSHFCGTHRMLANCEEDHDFERVGQVIMEYLGLSQPDLADLRDDLLDQGIIHS